MKTEQYYAFQCNYCGWKGERHFASVSSNFYCPDCTGPIPILKFNVQERLVKDTQDIDAVNKLINTTIIL